MSDILPSRIAEILTAANRLHEVRNCGMNKEGFEPEFDGITATAAIVFSAPVAQVTLLDADDQFFKSCVGFDMLRSSTKNSFCAHTLEMTAETMVVLDAEQDVRFKDNPFVSQQPHVRFYAGCPVSLHGQNIGTVCVYDFEPRAKVSDNQKDALKNLAVDAASIIEAMKLAA